MSADESESFHTTQEHNSTFSITINANYIYIHKDTSKTNSNLTCSPSWSGCSNNTASKSMCIAITSKLLSMI